MKIQKKTLILMIFFIQKKFENELKYIKFEKKMINNY